MGQRHILHCDCNCFYASVEMQEHPELRGKSIAVCPTQHDTGNLYAGLPQAAGFHPQPDERDALQEKNSRKMKRDVQTLRLHVSFWWAMQDSNLR